MNGADRKEINMLEWCKVTTLEAIGQAGFGYSFGALKDNHSPYIDTMKNVIPTFSSLFRLKGYIGPMFRLIPRSLSRAVAKWVPSGCIQRIGEMIDTQAKYSSDILESGKATLSDSTRGESYDILSTLIRTNAHAKEEDKLSEDQLRGQINTIVFAGFETTSSSLARTIHFLAEHPHIQDQLREELQAARADLRDCDTLPYLDAIVRETLRLFPPVPTIERYASKDWVVPLRYPTQDNERQIYIEKGTRLLLSLSRANRYTWGDDAEEFRPERWLNSLPQSVSKGGIPGVYSSMMTFGAGPRSCIGYKFAVLELKIILARLVETFRFAPGQQPVEWRNLGFMSPHVTSKGEDGTVVLDKAPSLPLSVSILR
ncbi:cytochrome P450 family protein [Rhizoctonia solani]|uniref:Cytochrome P450 family protein n=1 Tax=Rhizoctonia solani TaxID=456999 RepID=A0A8H8NY79_9AGAM|nr:cytochrome P450 family protein [Rhizoctonia solani]QRW21078.1 cytochrome P450 family protein [Rhizoctonia solani]